MQSHLDECWKMSDISIGKGNISQVNVIILPKLIPAVTVVD